MMTLIIGETRGMLLPMVCMIDWILKYSQICVFWENIT